MDIDWKAAQGRLAVKQDGIVGPVTWTALLTKIAGRTPPLASSFAAAFVAHASAYAIDANPERLAQFLGQCAHESGGFIYTREIWGPTKAQKAYDAPGNSLGNKPGDGYALRGGGLIEVTGRYWFDKIGNNIGLDLIGNPKLIDQPENAVLISLKWWGLNGMNPIADTGDTMMVSRAVNLGNPRSTKTPNGMASRVAFTNIGRAILA